MKKAVCVEGWASTDVTMCSLFSCWPGRTSRPHYSLAGLGGRVGLIILLLAWENESADNDS
jgi:hypothetical protein